MTAGPGPAVNLHAECSGFMFADSDGARVSWLPTPEIIRRCQVHDDLAAACRLVLLFHRGGPWTAADSDLWTRLGGAADVTTKSLCDRIRSVLGPDGQVRI